MPFKLAVVAQTLEIKLLYYEKYFKTFTCNAVDVPAGCICTEEVGS